MGDTDTEDEPTTEQITEEEEEEPNEEIPPAPPPPLELKLKPDPEDDNLRDEATALNELDWIEHAFDPEYEPPRLTNDLSKFIKDGYGKLGRKLDQSLLTDGLSMIAKTISGLTHAFVKLDLPGRSIIDISALNHFNHLRYVSLSGNHILDIKPLNSLQFLMTLDLSDNYLETMDGFQVHSYLRVLDVSKNFLRNLKGVIEHPHLQRLYASYNKLADFKVEDPKYLRELEVLELRKNRLKVFGGSGAKLPALKVLFLSQNSISKMADLSGWRLLEFVDLRRNKMSTLIEWITPNLKYINLSWNYIEDIKDVQTFLSGFPALTTFVLSNNPVVKRMERLEKLAIITCPKLTRINITDVTKQMREEAAAELKEEEEPEGE